MALLEDKDLLDVPSQTSEDLEKVLTLALERGVFSTADLLNCNDEDLRAMVKILQTKEEATLPGFKALLGLELQVQKERIRRAESLSKDLHARGERVQADLDGHELTIADLNARADQLGARLSGIIESAGQGMDEAQATLDSIAATQAHIDDVLASSQEEIDDTVRSIPPINKEPA